MTQITYSRLYLNCVLVFLLGLVVYLVLGFDPFLKRTFLTHLPQYDVIRQHPWRELFYNTPTSFVMTIFMIVTIKIKDVFFAASADADMIPLVRTYVFDVFSFCLLFLSIAVFVRTLRDLKLKNYKIYLATAYVFLNPVCFGYLFDPFYHVWTYLLLVMTISFLIHGVLCKDDKSLILSITSLVVTCLSHNLYSVVIVTAYSAGLVFLFKFRKKSNCAIAIAIAAIPLLITLKTYMLFGSMASDGAKTYAHIMIYPNVPDELQQQLIAEKKISEFFNVKPYDSIPQEEADKYLKENGVKWDEVQYEDDKYVMEHYPQYYFKTVHRAYIYYFMPGTLFHQFTYCCTKSRKVLYKVNPLFWDGEYNKDVKFLPYKGITDTRYSIVILTIYAAMLFYMIASLFNVSLKRNLSLSFAAGAVTNISAFIFGFFNAEVFMTIFITYFLAILLAYLAVLGVVLIKRLKGVDIGNKNKIFVLCLGMIYLITFTGTMVTFGENMRFRMGADLFMLPVLVAFFLDSRKHFKEIWIGDLYKKLSPLTSPIEKSLKKVFKKLGLV